MVALGGARGDEGALLLREVATALGRPALRLGQERAGEQRLRVAPGPLPFATPRLQPLAPEEQLAVLVEPGGEPPPAADERLVGELDGFSRLRRFSRLGPLAPSLAAGFPAEDQQPLGRQGARQGRRRRVERGEAHAPPHLAAGLPRRRQAHQPGEEAARHPEIAQAAPREACREPRLGVRGERAGHSPDLLIGGVGEDVLAPPAPERRQRELEERQVARPAGDVVDEALDEPGLEANAGELRRRPDRLGELLPPHRAEVHLAGRQAVGEGRRQLDRPAVEVGAQAEEQ